MATSVPRLELEDLRKMRTSIQRNLCANCSLFDWIQVESECLQQCGGCKVLQYCSPQCQAEHWALVHKAHCRMLARARQSEEAGKDPVGIFSQHPFPDPETDVQSGLSAEVLVALVQKVLMRMKSMMDPALFLHIDQLPQLEDMMEMNRRQIWAHRKLFPEQYKDVDLLDGFSASYPLYPKTSRLQPYDEASLDTWSILHLVWGGWIGHWVTIRMSSLKDPRQAIPLDAWEDFIENDVGLFPVRLKEMVDVFFSNQIISFKELLQAFCGGSLVQHCSFCDASMTVEAVHQEVKGCKKGVPTVSLLPHMAPMFCCGAPACDEEMSSKGDAWWKWRAALALARNKLFGNRCNFCFKLAEEVHR